MEVGKVFSKVSVVSEEKGGGGVKNKTPNYF